MESLFIQLFYPVLLKIYPYDLWFGGPGLYMITLCEEQTEIIILHCKQLWNQKTQTYEAVYVKLTFKSISFQILQYVKIVLKSYHNTVQGILWKFLI